MNTSIDAAQIELRLLKTFLVLMQERSVSRAAMRLNLSQPTMSHALGRLRRLFNDPLLLNTHGGMTPTARGLDVQAQVEELVQRFDRLLAPDEDFDPATSRVKLSIMAPEFAGDLIAPPLLHRLEQEAPHVEIEFIAADPSTALELLEQGTVDFRLGWWPDPAPALRHKLLWTEKLVCIARAGHPRWSAPVRAAEYFSARHLRIKRLGQSFSMMTIDAAAARAGHSIRVGSWVQNAATMVNVVATTDMVGTLSERLASHLIPTTVTISPLPFDVPDLKVVLYWHERTHRHPAHRWFRHLFADVVRQVEKRH
ncbi:MAG TPA: LysR family transcriptional regulator [Stellaceae bacterium]|nr:LysR family transcriptional regulator [Stellaceae bacterium]